MTPTLAQIRETFPEVVQIDTDRLYAYDADGIHHAATAHLSRLCWREAAQKACASLPRCTHAGCDEPAAFEATLARLCLGHIYEQNVNGSRLVPKGWSAMRHTHLLHLLKCTKETP